MKYLDHTHNILTAHSFIKPNGQEGANLWAEYVSLEAEFESFIFELLSLNNYIKKLNLNSII